MRSESASAGRGISSGAISNSCFDEVARLGLDTLRSSSSDSAGRGISVGSASEFVVNTTSLKAEPGSSFLLLRISCEGIDLGRDPDRRPSWTVVRALEPRFASNKSSSLSDPAGNGMISGFNELSSSSNPAGRGITFGSNISSSLSDPAGKGISPASKESSLLPEPAGKGIISGNIPFPSSSFTPQACDSNGSPSSRFGWPRSKHVGKRDTGVLMTVTGLMCC